MLGHSIKVQTAAADAIRTYPEKRDVHESIILEFLYNYCMKFRNEKPK